MIPRIGTGWERRLPRHSGYVVSYLSLVQSLEHRDSEPRPNVEQVDYRAIIGRLWEAMPAEEFIILVSSRALLGDPLLVTQHVVAGTRWELISPTDAVGYHQIYAPHLKYEDEAKTKVLLRGYAHGTNKHWYKKIDGVWKFAGLEPEVRWFEYDFDKIFVFARDLFGGGGHRMAAKD